MQKHKKRKCLYCGKLFTPDARKKPQEGENELQEFFNRKSRKGKGAKLHFDSFALQDSLKLQIELIVGLTSTLIGSTLQESIANAVECYHTRGQDILWMGYRKS